MKNSNSVARILPIHRMSQLSGSQNAGSPEKSIGGQGGHAGPQISVEATEAALGLGAARLDVNLDVAWGGDSRNAL